jgi:hypothetical protein
MMPVFQSFMFYDMLTAHIKRRTVCAEKIKRILRLEESKIYVMPISKYQDSNTATEQVSLAQRFEFWR